MFVLYRLGRVRFANAMVGAAQDIATTLKVRLFTNDAVLIPSGVPADFTEATFGGYDEVVTTYGANVVLPFVGDDAPVRITGDSIAWDCTSAPQTIRGWYLYEDDGGDIIAAEKYGTPHVLEVGSRHRLFLDLKLGQCD